jgi:DNA-binding MarR family transcriptional regulator
VADVAAEFAIGIGSASKVVDRLEARGWVARQPNPSDRRSSLPALTDDGRRLVDVAEGTFGERLAELIAGALDTPPITATAQALAQLRSVLERDQIGVPTG